jgi:hypothetical protein
MMNDFRDLFVTYQLLQIPAADLHVSLVFIQALGELLRIHLTAPCTPVAVLGCISLSRNAIVLRLLLSWLRGPTTEETANCVAKARANCYTSVSWSVPASGRDVKEYIHSCASYVPDHTGTS